MLSETKGESMLINFFHGMVIAIADPVPGVSGGTLAFILGFYDKFIDSLHDFFGSQGEKRKEAFKYLFKLGLGWLFRFYSKLRKI